MGIDPFEEFEQLTNWPARHNFVPALDVWEDEQTWGKKLQKAAQKEPVGFSTEIEKIPDDWEKAPVAGGSTDVAEVSHITPTAGFRFKEKISSGRLR